MSIITGHDVCLVPLAGSHNDGDFGEQLKQLAVDLFTQLLGAQANRVNLHACPWLSDTELLQKMLYKDGISLTTNAQDAQRVKHLYKALVSKNGQGRGLHLLRLFLSLMYAGNEQVTQLGVAQMYQDATQPYPSALSKVAQQDSFLTSRVDIDVTFTPDFSSAQLIEDSIRAIVPARIFPTIKLHYPDILLTSTRAISAGTFFTMVQKTTPQRTIDSSLHQGGASFGVSWQKTIPEAVAYGISNNQGQTVGILESN